MAVVVQVPARLKHDSLFQVPLVAGADYEIDASGLQFVEPIGLVHLTLCLNRVAAYAASVQFTAPTNRSVNSYLARMDFYTVLPPPIQCASAVDPGALNRNDSSDVLVGLRRFHGWNESEDLLVEVESYLSHQNLPAGFPVAIWEILSELADNAANHSQSPCGAFLAAQTYSGRRHLAVGDAGIGIRKHLTGNPRYAHLKSDAEAIQEAIKPEVTGTCDRRGYGLDLVQEHAANVGRKQGELRIISGTGRAHIEIRETERHPEFWEASENVSGTLVEIVLFG